VVRGEEQMLPPAAAAWTLMAAMETFVAKHAAKIRGRSVASIGFCFGATCR
jgi:hypothetical protein